MFRFIFHYIDEMLDCFYKRLESGSVNRTHIFSMEHWKPGIFQLKDSTDSDIRTQDLRKGNMQVEERKRFLENAFTNLKQICKMYVLLYRHHLAFLGCLLFLSCLLTLLRLRFFKLSLRSASAERPGAVEEHKRASCINSNVCYFIDTSVRNITNI